MEVVPGAAGKKASDGRFANVPLLLDQKALPEIPG